MGFQLREITGAVSTALRTRRFGALFLDCGRVTANSEITGDGSTKLPTRPLVRLTSEVLTVVLLAAGLDSYPFRQLDQRGSMGMRSRLTPRKLLLRFSNHLRPQRPWIRIENRAVSAGKMNHAPSSTSFRN